MSRSAAAARPRVAKGKTTRVEAPPLKPSTSASALPTVTSSSALAPVKKPASKKGKRSTTPTGQSRGVVAPMPSAVTAPATPMAGVVASSSAKGDNSRLTVRLDLNLDIEVELKAKIEGDLTLTLFE